MPNVIGTSAIAVTVTENSSTPGLGRTARARAVTTPQRGQVFRIDLGHASKPWLIVSNNARNRNLESVLAARITPIGALAPRTMRAIGEGRRIALALS
jgi:hypothetical protein